jgi:hypothetical protein
VSVAIKSIMNAPAAQNYSLLGYQAAGIVPLLVARFGLRSTFFQTKRESWRPEHAADRS